MIDLSTFLRARPRNSYIFIVLYDIITTVAIIIYSILGQGCIPL